MAGIPRTNTQGEPYMADYLKIFNENITADQKDGTAVSEGSFENPIVFNLNVTNEQVGYVKLAIRCDEGYIADGDVAVSVKSKTDGASTNASRYQLCADNDYDVTAVRSATFSDTLTIKGLTDTNKIFWLKCTSSKDEKPSVDKGCVLHAAGTIKAKA